MSDPLYYLAKNELAKKSPYFREFVARPKGDPEALAFVAKHTKAWGEFLANAKRKAKERRNAKSI